MQILVGHYTHSLSVDATIMATKNCPKIWKFQVGGELQTKAKTSELADIKLFPNNNSTTKSITSIDSKSLTKTDDFGNFQHSPGPFSSTTNSSASFSSGSSEKLASSLEKFKLSIHSLPSTEGARCQNSKSARK